MIGQTSPADLARTPALPAAVVPRRRGLIDWRRLSPRIWIGASLDNTPSIRGFAAAGFQPVLTLTYLRLLGIRRVWMAGDTAASPALVTRARECLAV